MKFKHLLIVSLILAVLAVGAVSASDVADELAVDDSNDDSIAIKDNNKDLISEDEDEDYDSDDEPELYIDDEIYTNTDEWYIGEVYNENYLNGTVTVSIDGTQYFNKAYSNTYDANVYIDSSKLPFSLKSGKHFVVLSYLTGKTTYSINKTAEFKYNPTIEYVEEIAVGESSIINIEGLPGASGTATLYNYDFEDDKIGSVVATTTISNGKGLMTVSGLTYGYHEFFLNMTINGQQFSNKPEIEVNNNTAGYTATVTSQITVGNNAVVTFSGPKTNGWLYIYVDGVSVKEIKYLGGTLSEPISGLSVGQHVIDVVYNAGFYHKTLNVKVNDNPSTVSLALKKVTVKKSAKNLVLKATLKINKKTVKGKKITFKFNGKKIKATTNKKGVATAKISSKILKKLKVGKKITYTATYGKITKKVAVKVKK